MAISSPVTSCKGTDMSGYLETIVILGTVDTAVAGEGLARLHDALVSQFQFNESLASCIFRLHIDDPTSTPMGIVDSQALPVDSLAEAGTRVPAFVARGNALIGGVSDQVELYGFQLPSLPGRFILRAVLASSFLEAVYTDDGFDSEQAHALRNFTLTLATCMGAEGFALELWQPSSLPLEERTIEQFTQRALRPTLAELQAHPNYEIGIRSPTVTRAMMVQTWGEANVLESTEGYLIADLLTERDEG